MDNMDNMDNEDKFNRSLDELLKQILAESEADPEPEEDPESDELYDLITSEVDPDLHVCIQHEVNKAVSKLIPVIHRHIMTSVTSHLETYSEMVTGEVRQATTMYSQSVTESVDDLRAEIAKLQRTAQLLKWIVIVSWILLIGLLFGSMGVYAAG
ncbi:hypothetical protein [Candidatus Entotheonella palauensis]|nr:hypothetical protein [Candidatus Entotheonella palauensis]